MSRPPKYETPRTSTISFKITDGQAKMLEELAKQSGLKKTDIIHKALLTTLLKAPAVSVEVFKKVPAMVKSGTFSADAVSKAFDDSLFGKLDKMYAKECEKVIKKREAGELTKGKKKKGFIEEIGDKAAML